MIQQTVTWTTWTARARATGRSYNQGAKESLWPPSGGEEVSRNVQIWSSQCGSIAYRDGTVSSNLAVTGGPNCPLGTRETLYSFSDWFFRPRQTWETGPMTWEGIKWPINAEGKAQRDIDGHLSLKCSLPTRCQQHPHPMMWQPKMSAGQWSKIPAGWEPTH